MVYLQRDILITQNSSSLVLALPAPHASSSRPAKALTAFLLASSSLKVQAINGVILADVRKRVSAP